MKLGMQQGWIVLAVGMSCLTAGAALADPADKAAAPTDKAGAEMAKMMAAYEKAGTPGDQHKQLQKQVGKWNLEMKSWMAPGQPPMESKGTAESKAILGDRYIQTSVTSEFMGKPFTGLGITGYDNTKKKIVGTWIDSTSTSIMHSEGTPDATGKLVNAKAVNTDPVTGKDSRMRIVERWESDDKKVEEFYEKRGAKEVKAMEITYTRASK